MLSLIYRQASRSNKSFSSSKGDSSHWINENKLIPERFAWGRGYGAFSVSHSDVPRVAAYIAGQEEHHKKKTFAEEYELFVKRYGLEWQLSVSVPL
jgi:Transposase IS200 like